MQMVLLKLRCLYLLVFVQSSIHFHLVLIYFFPLYLTMEFEIVLLVATCWIGSSCVMMRVHFSLLELGCVWMYVFIVSGWQEGRAEFLNSGKIIAGQSGCFPHVVLLGVIFVVPFVVTAFAGGCCNCWVDGIKWVVLYCSERRPSVVCDWPSVGADFLLELGVMCWPFPWTLDTVCLSVQWSLSLLSGCSVSSARAAHHFQACCRVYFTLTATALKWQTDINFVFIAWLS